MEEKPLADSGLGHDLIGAGMPESVQSKYFEGSVDHFVLFIFRQAPEFIVHAVNLLGRTGKVYVNDIIGYEAGQETERIYSPAGAELPLRKMTHAHEEWKMPP